MNRDPQNALQLEHTAQKAKRLLLHRSPSGVNGIRSFSRSLGIADDLGGVQITEEELRRALKENSVALESHEIRTIFDVLDRQGRGTIDPTDFLATMSNDLNPLRRVWFQRVWRIFRKDPSDGSVQVQELQQRFLPEQHPAVVRGEQTAEEIRQDFESTFNDTTNPDSKVSMQEFAQYYSGVSSSFSNDDDFVALLRGVWPLPGVCEDFTVSLAKRESQYRAPYHTDQSLAEKTEVARRETMTAALLFLIKHEHAPIVLSSCVVARAVCLSLARADEAHTGFVSTSSFLSALRPHRLYMPDTALLSCLDTNGDGSVDILYYETLLLPPPSATRMMLLARLWLRCFGNKDTAYRVPVQELHRRYQASSPADKDGFLTSWDVRTAIEGKVELQELIQWYVPQSAAETHDASFQDLLHRQWGKYDE